MYLIGKRRCPNCGVKGKLWRRKPNVYICPNCKTFFSDFGIVLSSRVREEEDLT